MSMKCAIPIFCKSAFTAPIHKKSADIANKIVAVYQDKRVEEEKDILNRAVATMNEEVAKQQKAVDASAAEVARIRDEEHIVDLNQEGKEDTQAPVNTIVVKQESEVNEAETQEATLENQTAARSRT